jgi:hypothetical protein
VRIRPRQFPTTKEQARARSFQCHGRSFKALTEITPPSTRCPRKQFRSRVGHGKDGKAYRTQIPHGFKLAQVFTLHRAQGLELQFHCTSRILLIRRLLKSMAHPATFGTKLRTISGRVRRASPCKSIRWPEKEQQMSTQW